MCHVNITDLYFVPMIVSSLFLGVPASRRITWHPSFILSWSACLIHASCWGLCCMWRIWKAFYHCSWCWPTFGSPSSRTHQPLLPLPGISALRAAEQLSRGWCRPVLSAATSCFTQQWEAVFHPLVGKCASWPPKQYYFQLHRVFSMSCLVFCFL